MASAPRNAPFPSTMSADPWAEAMRKQAAPVIEIDDAKAAARSEWKSAIRPAECRVASS